MEEHAHPRHNKVPAEEETVAMSGCLVRLGWLIVAPLGLLVLGVSLAKNGAGAMSVESILYWLVAAMAVVIRYIDVFRHQGQTLQGKPASDKDWRRYSISLGAVALAGWCAAVWLA